MKIIGNYTDMERTLSQLEDMPNAKTVALLDAALAASFAEATAAVHIDTGSLKSSGKSEGKRVKARKRWEGYIQFGGPSTGVNNPVDYAIYEKRRGGAHDFFAGLPTLHPKYVQAIIKGMT